MVKHSKMIFYFILFIFYDYFYLFALKKCQNALLKESLKNEVIFSKKKNSL
jgi:hypothetical protein